MLLRRLLTTPRDAVLRLDGTAVFVDISGFTRLSERVARRGNEGAELLVDTINACFSTLLPDAYANGASVLKFSGDALLLWFEGERHAARACSSAFAMRRALRRAPPGTFAARLRMSTGVHSGSYEMFLVGGSHREHLIAGPAASTLVAMEAAAAPGQILLSDATAALLAPACLGSTCGPGILLAREPPRVSWKAPEESLAPDDDAIAACLSTALRAHVLSGPAHPEHRAATVAFLRFGKLDELIETDGTARAAEQVDELVRVVQEGADRYEICILGSDIATDGATLLLSAGAPRALGDDEERMLLALRHATDANPRLPMRVGVNRGHVFTGEVGPSHRRTYVAMGDTTNLAARLAAKAPWGSIYVMPTVVKRSRTRFATTAVAPFAVKGKIRPVGPLELGAAQGSAHVRASGARLPLVGRDRELAWLRAAVANANQGKGALIEIVGETGAGKSRLLREARLLAGEMRFIHSTCEAYRREIPYSAWREPLRHLLGLDWDESDHVVLTALREELQRSRPDLLPWLSLLAIAFGVTTATSTEVDELAPESRASKLHETVLGFLRRALVVPTLVQFEHAHLMDAASAALLEVLADELDSAAWLVLVTRRVAAGGFGPQPPHRRMELGGLSPRDTQELARATAEAAELPPHVVRLAVDRAAGNPEFLLDLLSAAASAGPEALPDTVEAAATAWLDTLDPRDRALVRRAAILGLTFHPRRIPDVLDAGTPLPSDEDWDRLSTVFARDPEGHVRFKRPALQEAGYASLPFKLRRALHAIVAESLELDLLDDPDADPAILSLHFFRAEDHARAYHYAMLSAERATERFSHADAARLYRRAIDAARTSGVVSEQSGGRSVAHAWEQLGNALRCTGEPEAATRAFRQARRLLLDDPVAQARLCHRQAQVADVRESLTTAVRWLHRGLRIIDEIQSEEATSWRARLHSLLAGVRNRQGRWSEAARLCRAAISEAEAVEELSALAHASYALDWALVESGRPDEATHSWRALEIYEQMGDPEHESTVLNNLGMFAYFQGRWDDAVELYRRAGACAERAGKPGDVARTDCNVGEILADQGHLEEARIYLERARRVWTATKEHQGVAFVDLLLGRLAVRDGRDDEALPLLEAAMSDLRRFRIDAYAGFAAALIAEAEAVTGAPSRALSIARHELEAGGRYVPLLHRICAIALARAGQADAAQGELRRSLAVSRERGSEYDIAATVDVMDVLGLAPPNDAHERDMILARLRIERLPNPRLPQRARRLDTTLV